MRAGWASIILGFALVVVIQWTRPALGAFGVVPEAVAGLTAMALGVVAIVLAGPPGDWWRTTRGGRWVLLGLAFLAASGVVIAAIDEIGSSDAPERTLARLVVGAGVVVTMGILVTVMTRLALAGVALVWRVVLAAGGDRWFQRWLH